MKLSEGRSLQYLTFNPWEFTYRVIGNFTLAYAGSFLCWVLIERPCMTIFSPRKKSSRTSTQANGSAKKSSSDPLSSSSCADSNSKEDGLATGTLKEGA